MQEQVVQEPDVMDIVYVQSMAYLKKREEIRPGRANLSRDIAPQTFNAYIVNAPAEPILLCISSQVMWLTFPIGTILDPHRGTLPSTPQQAGSPRHDHRAPGMGHHILPWPPRRGLIRSAHDCCCWPGAR